MLPFAAMSATSEVPAAFRNASVRPGAFRLLRQAIDDVLSRRRLVQYLVRADIKKKGADTFLGNLWWIMDPLLQMIVYVVLVSVIFQRTTPQYPLFIMSAILPWKWFTSSMNDAAGSVVGAGQLIKQIQFPKIVLPMASTSAAVVGFAFGLVPLAGLMLLFSSRISPYVLLVPVIAVVQYVFTLGLAFMVAGANVFFRDLGNVMRHLLRLWFYLSPGLYSLSTLEATNTFQQYPILGVVARLNPFAVLFESYRAVIYGTPDGPPHAPDWQSLAILLGVSVVLAGLGAIFFKRLEPMYAKVL